MIKCLSVILILFITTCTTAQQDTGKVYMFAYFINNGADGLHYAWSKDGLSFNALKDSAFLKPAVSKDKLMRDPCIIRGADNLFYMVWTVSWNDKGIGYASSPDLVHWSEQRYIPVMEEEPDARNCWAPEISYDKTTGQYMIYWSTTITGRFPSADTSVEKGYNHRLYYTLTRDFNNFSKTQLLYDEGFNVIDASIVPDKKGFIMFLKDETPKPVPQKNIRTAVSKKLAGPYSPPSPPITGAYWAEGPSSVKIAGRWIVYFDKYRDHRYGAVASTDLVNWTDISGEVHFPKGTRHGTVFVISQKEFALFFK